MYLNTNNMPECRVSMHGCRSLVESSLVAQGDWSSWLGCHCEPGTCVTICLSLHDKPFSTVKLSFSDHVCIYLLYEINFTLNT